MATATTERRDIFTGPEGSSQQSKVEILSDLSNSTSYHGLIHDPASPKIEELDTQPLKCSAVHTMERDMPDFDYSHLVKELKDRMIAECEANPGIYSHEDICKCKNDEWFVTRFLLRNKLDMEESFKMMKRAMRFNFESLTSSLRRQDFPSEFYQIGGLFPYEVDRKGNLMVYLRVRVHKKVSEIQEILQAYVYFTIRYADELAKGRGISVVIDCSGAGLANADMETLWYLIDTLRNYFPKGLSYFLVHELPWLLKPIWLIAKAWVPEEHSQLIKFSDSTTIYEYIDRENLPDFMGGTCKRNYRQPPEDCTNLEQAAKLWGIPQDTVRKVIKKFIDYLPEGTLERFEENCAKYNLEDQENKPLN